MQTAVKQALNYRITLHSFRIGAVLRLSASEQIKTMGRWRSDAYKVYIRVISFATQCYVALSAVLVCCCRTYALDSDVSRGSGVRHGATCSSASSLVVYELPVLLRLVRVHRTPLCGSCVVYPACPAATTGVRPQ